MCLFTLVKSYVLFYFFHCFYLYLTFKNSDLFLVLTKEQVQTSLHGHRVCEDLFIMIFYNLTLKSIEIINKRINLMNT